MVVIKKHWAIQVEAEGRTEEEAAEMANLVIDKIKLTYTTKPVAENLLSARVSETRTMIG